MNLVIRVNNRHCRLEVNNEDNIAAAAAEHRVGSKKYHIPVEHCCFWKNSPGSDMFLGRKKRKMVLLAGFF